MRIAANVLQKKKRIGVGGFAGAPRTTFNPLFSATGDTTHSLKNSTQHGMLDGPDATL